MNFLVLCTANFQRSKTAEELFSALDKNNHYKSAGLSKKYVEKNNSTLCTEEMLQWSDKIIVFEDKHLERIREHTGTKYLDKIINLNIDDKYKYFERDLVLLLLEKFKDIKNY